MAWRHEHSIEQRLVTIHLYERNLLNLLVSNSPYLTSIDELQLKPMGPIQVPASGWQRHISDLFKSDFVLLLSLALPMSTHLVFLHLSGESEPKNALAWTKLIDAVAVNPILEHFQLSSVTAIEDWYHNDLDPAILQALMHLFKTNTRLQSFVLLDTNIFNTYFCMLCEALMENPASSITELRFNACGLDDENGESLLYNTIRRLLDMEIVTSLNIDGNRLGLPFRQLLIDLVCKPAYPRMLELNAESYWGSQYTDTMKLTYTQQQSALFSVLNRRIENLNLRYFSFQNAAFGPFNFFICDKMLQKKHMKVDLLQMMFCTLLFNSACTVKLPLCLWTYIFSFFRMSMFAPLSQLSV